MTRTAPLHRYSFAEYLELEAASNTRHEYWNGEIYAMGGGSPAHAALAMAVGASLVAQTRGGPCRVFSSDLMVRVKASGMATYPDVTVVCGELEPDPDNPNAVTNPVVLIEVLSESTGAYDRGEKLEQYKTIESLQTVLLISQTSCRVEAHHRNARGFDTEVLTTGQTCALDCVGAALDLDAIYADAGI
jgi:Uma2 family endonuclease